jgi:hypothetical protein
MCPVLCHNGTLLARWFEKWSLIFDGLRKERKEFRVSAYPIQIILKKQKGKLAFML